MGKWEWLVRDVEERIGLQEAFFEACRWGERDECKRHIKAGAKLNAYTEAGNTPLTAASFAGRTKIVELLIQEGVDVNRTSTHDGCTPIMCCIGGLHTYAVYKAVISRLVKAGADLNAKNHENQTAFEYADSLERDAAIRYLNELRTCPD